MDNILKHIRKIVEANNNKRLAIFMGSGVSKNCENEIVKIPDWGELIEELKHELDIYNENDYLKVAQLYYQEFGDANYYNKVKEYFPDYIRPSVIHENILKINPVLLITTNWDSIIETTVDENAYLYDLIASDKDLVKTTLENKIIKMHGDLNNHNIVFKEDDYLNYSQNFPLIENYIKSILSTHTVLFMGYSYNDINLKYIMKWLQAKSETTPPKYLITFDNNITQTKYLMNHGITCLYLNEISEEDKTITNKYTAKTKTFLDKILNWDERNIIRDNSITEVLNFILKRLEPLNNFNFILHSQIITALTNCRINNESEMPSLEFLDTKGFKSNDYNPITRQIYELFIKILINYDSLPAGKEKGNLHKILTILKKANVCKIVVTKNLEQYKEFFDFTSIIKESNNKSIEYLLNFDSLKIVESENEIDKNLHQAFQLYNSQQFEESLQAVNSVISSTIKQKLYIPLFMSLFNKNVLNKHIMYLGIKNKDLEDLEDRFKQLPHKVKYIIKPILEIVNFEYIYHQNYKISQEIKKQEDRNKINSNGGISYTRENYKMQIKHENIIYFILSNKLMIESYTEFKDLNILFLEYSICRQSLFKFTKFNKIEMYSLIKYCNKDNIIRLLNPFFNNKNKISIDDDNKKWLLDIVFKNFVSMYIQNNKVITNFDQIFTNIIYLLSIIKLDKEEINKVIELLLEIIKTEYNSFTIYKIINQFVGIQENIYESINTNENLLTLVDSLIEKIIHNTANGFEFEAIRGNSFYNIFQCSEKNHVLYKNMKLIEKLLSEISKMDQGIQLNLLSNFVLSIYIISDTNIKNIILDYINSVRNKDYEDLFLNLMFNLDLTLLEIIELDSKTTELLDKVISENENSETYFYIIEDIKNKVLRLKSESNDLETRLNKLDKIISKKSEKKKFAR